MALIDNIRKFSYLDMEKDEYLVENEIREINSHPKEILFTQDDEKLTEGNYKNAFSIEKELINSNLKYAFPETTLRNEVKDDYLNPVIVIVQ